MFLSTFIKSHTSGAKIGDYRLSICQQTSIKGQWVWLKVFTNVEIHKGYFITSLVPHLVFHSFFIFHFLSFSLAPSLNPHVKSRNVFCTSSPPSPAELSWTPQSTQCTGLHFLKHSVCVMNEEFCWTLHCSRVVYHSKLSWESLLNHFSLLNCGRKQNAELYMHSRK